MRSRLGEKNTVKVFVLYLLENISYPLEYWQINDIVMQTDYVMYLDFAESFIEMLDGGLIEKRLTAEGLEVYSVTDRGFIVAREMKSVVPYSVLEQSLSAALRYLDFARRGVKCFCKLLPTEQGKYTVQCTLTEKERVILDVTLEVDTKDRAEAIKRNFDSRPDIVYRGINALLAGNVNFLF